MKTKIASLAFVFWGLWGVVVAGAESRQADVVTIVDTSTSMRATGMDPERTSLLVAKLLADIVPGRFAAIRLLDLTDDAELLPSERIEAAAYPCPEDPAQMCFPVRPVGDWGAAARSGKFGALERPARGDSQFKKELERHLEQRSTASMFYLAFRAAQGVFDSHGPVDPQVPRTVLWLSDGKSEDPDSVLAAITEVVRDGANVEAIVFGRGSTDLARAAGLAVQQVAGPPELMKAFAGAFRRIIRAPFELDGLVGQEPEFRMLPAVAEAWVVVYGDSSLGTVTLGSPSGARVAADFAAESWPTAGAYRVAYLERPEAGIWIIAAQGGGPQVAYAVVEHSALSPVLIEPRETTLGSKGELVVGVTADGELIEDPDLLAGAHITAEIAGRKLDFVAAGKGRFTAPFVFEKSGELTVDLHLKSPVVDRRTRAAVFVYGSFWERWGWLILTLLAILLTLGIVAGFVLPHRFPRSCALVFVPDRQEIEEHPPQPLRQWKGVRIGFYRHARAFLHASFRVSGDQRGALAWLQAERGGARVFAGQGASLWRETLDSGWQPVPAAGSRVRNGEVFRCGDNGPFFQVSTRSTFGDSGGAAARVLLVGLGLAALAGSLRAGEHTRVVLDVSKSMNRTDPGGLARLSAVLLFDLAQPDLRLDDSFEILPFHPTGRWLRPEDPPPVAIGERIRPQSGRRDAFADQVSRLPYAAQWTYFYPGLAAATADLEAIPGDQEVRTIVIVTDGLPEAPTRDAELSRIRSELMPRMASRGIRLFVLAFGNEAQGDRAFFDQLVAGPSGAALGEVFLDPNGSRLVESMIQLFTRAFGYSESPPRSLPVTEIDLEGGATPDRAAVVIYRPLAGAALPSLRLTAPPAAPRQPNLAGPLAGTRVSGASYALLWVLSPFAGLHRLDTDAAQGTVAVLRPTRVQLEVRPRGGAGAFRAMARTPVPIEILLRSSGGAGPPPEVALSFQTHGPREATLSGGAAARYVWEGRLLAPSAGPSKSTPEGRIFDAEVTFERDPASAEPFYAGHVEVWARRGLATVGALQGAQAVRVEVYPLLSVVAVPGKDLARIGDRPPRALRQGESGCARFSLKLDVGRLPHPEKPIYALRAEIDGAVQTSGPLAGASFTLDDFPLEIAGTAPAGTVPPADWSAGRALPLAALLGEHRVCVQVGQPVQHDEVEVDLPLRFTLLESPYDGFPVVQPFILKALIARPSFLGRYGSLLVMGTAWLSLVAAAWYLRDRPDLPGDLRFSLTQEGQRPKLQVLERGPWWRRLLGLVEERPLVAGGQLLAWLRPSRDELFVLRPLPTVHVQTAAGASGRAAAEIEAGRFYRLETTQGVYVLRLEYLP